MVMGGRWGIARWCCSSLPLCRVAFIDSAHVLLLIIVVAFLPPPSGLVIGLVHTRLSCCVTSGPAAKYGDVR